MLSPLLCALLFCAQPDSFLVRTAATVEAQREVLDEYRMPAEEVARRIIAGGKLHAGGAPSLVSEVSGRAGGLMLLTPWAGTATAQDVLLWFGDDAHPLDVAAVAGAYVVGFGDTIPGASASIPPCHEARALSPSVGMVIQAWIFVAEVVAACTRAKHMPVFYETVGLPSGFPRIAAFQAKGIFFHPECTVAPQAAGRLGEAYITALSDTLRRCERENRAGLDRAGQWVAQTLRSRRKPWMLCMGHFLPGEIADTDLGTRYRSATYNAGFSNEPLPKLEIGKGDAVLFVGYQHPPTPVLEHCKVAGARAVYSSVLADRNFRTGPGMIWLDPMWPWADACVTLAGYDIPILSPSGVVGAAIAWEIDRVATGQP